jgi:hypothetical protein
MRLFIIAHNQLGIPAVQIQAKIKELLQGLEQSLDTQVYVVGEHFPSSFIQFCYDQNEVTIIEQKEADKMMKQITNAAIIHFGSNVNGAKSFPQYFIPLLLPEHIQGVGKIEAYLLKRRFKKWLQNAFKVICINDWIKEAIIQFYPGLNYTIVDCCVPITAPKSFEWYELSSAKDKLTQGDNYFLVFAPAARLVSILKEFSIFKKWQHTTMRLVFIVETDKELIRAHELLKGYKFKEAVSIHLAEDLSLEWIAATYSILWEDINYLKANWIEYAVQYDIPMLFDHQIGLPETWIKAGEVFDFSAQQALSNHFKLYYKDEVYRQARARMGREWNSQLNIDRMNLGLFNKIVLSHITG